MKKAAYIIWYLVVSLIKNKIPLRMARAKKKKKCTKTRIMAQRWELLKKSLAYEM
jgi:hypothetical protein